MKKYVVAKSADGKTKVVKIKSIEDETLLDYHDEFDDLLGFPAMHYLQVFEVEVENGDKLEVNDVIEHPEYEHSCIVAEVHDEVHEQIHKNWIYVLFDVAIKEE